MTKQDRRVVRSLKAIDDAYLQLLTEEEFEKISVSEIARRADIDRKTFYLHYNNVDELLEHLGDTHAENFILLMHEHQSTDQMRPVDAFFLALNELISENLFFYCRIAKLQESFRFWEKLQHCGEELVEEMIADYPDIAESLYPSGVKFYTAGIFDVYLSWLRGEIDAEMSSLQEQLKYCIRTGIPL